MVIYYDDEIMQSPEEEILGILWVRTMLKKHTL